VSVDLTSNDPTYGGFSASLILSNVSYTKQVGENEVELKALVDAIGCRRTDAEWSYRYPETELRRRP
jgi:glucose-6-phosphate dehydrogenase assembly protein OpcA